MKQFDKWTEHKQHKNEVTVQHNKLLLIATYIFPLFICYLFIIDIVHEVRYL